MRAFWLFSRNIGDGSEANPARPDLDNLGQYTIPGDIVRFQGPVGNDHTHLLVGGIVLPDDNLDGIAGSRHFHYLIYNGTSWIQETVDNVGVTPDHTHTYPVAASGFPLPDYFLVFWGGTDTDADTVLANPNNLHIVEATLSGNVITGLDNTPWTAPQQTSWYNNILAILGMKLPAEVDRGRRVILLLLGSLTSRMVQDERTYRFNQL